MSVQMLMNAWAIHMDVVLMDIAKIMMVPTVAFAILDIPETEFSVEV